MAVIYHIASDTDWHAAHLAGVYRAASLATEGFIHLSTASQVAAVANFLFRGRDDLRLLHVDEARLSAELRYEEADAAWPPFPHLYGPLNLDAVVFSEPYLPDATGTFQAPGQSGAR